MKHAATDARPAFAFQATTAFRRAFPVVSGGVLRVRTDPFGADEAVTGTLAEVSARPATAAAIRKAWYRPVPRRFESWVDLFMGSSFVRQARSPGFTPLLAQFGDSAVPGR
jgi:hypothetical protein